MHIQFWKHQLISSQLPNNVERSQTIQTILKLSEKSYKPSQQLSNCPEIIWIIRPVLKRTGFFSNHPEISKQLWNHSEIFQNIWTVLKTVQKVLYHMEISRRFWNYRRSLQNIQSRQFWNHLDRSEFVRTLHWRLSNRQCLSYEQTFSGRKKTFCLPSTQNFKPPLCHISQVY